MDTSDGLDTSNNFNDLEQLYKPDRVDFKIMDLLQKDGRMRDEEIARRVNLERTSVNRRIKKLKSEKYILNFQAVLDRKKLDLNYLVITMVMLESHGTTETDKFERSIKENRNILQWWLLNGSWDYMLLFVARTQDHYWELYRDLMNLANVKRSRSFPPVYTSPLAPLPIDHASVEIQSR
jgi:Lrp/AsnC family leucine-responsive transcriptional regulator